MGVTIYDVAREAGVSHTTVSNVINDRDGGFPVSEKTRKKVWEAIRRTGYKPSFAARALASRRTNVIGCLVNPVVGAFTNSFFREVFAGVEAAVLPSDYSLLIDSIGRYEPATADVMPMRLETDGYLVFAEGGDEALLDLNGEREDETSSRPVVLVERTSPGEGFSRVGIDNAKGARLVIDHLLELGHERIAVLRGLEENFSARMRFEAMRARLEERGAGLPDELVATTAGNPQTGYSAVKELMSREAGRRGAGFTAVATFNDGAAAGAARGLREAGLRIPEDVSVVGFDDVPLLREIETPLTTVHVPVRELGLRAGRMLLGMLGRGGAPSPSKGGSIPPAEEVVDVSLVARDSSARPGRGWPGRGRYRRG